MLDRRAPFADVDGLPPPLAAVLSSQVETIKIGKGKQAKKETFIVVGFSGALTRLPPTIRALTSLPR